jgi:uncharacterized protein (TIGR03435 family)
MKTFAVLLLLSFTAVCGVAQNAPLAFETASIKANNSGSGSAGVGDLASGQFRATNALFTDVVMAAYGVQEFQITERPSWFDVARYDIEARPDSSIAPERLREVFQPMLRTLLAERFKLALHRERVEMRMYELVVATTGTKLKQAGSGNCESTFANPCGGFNGAPTRIAGQRISMPQLVARLSRSLGRFVVDKTNLNGLFDFTVEWTIPQTYKSPVDVGPPPPRSAGLSIFTALEAQAGLRLEPVKGSVEVLVIDHVERPQD